MSLTTTIILLTITIFSSLYLIKNLTIIKKLPKENVEQTIILLGIVLLIASIFFFNIHYSGSSIELWKGNEIELLKTNKSLNVALQPLFNFFIFVFKKEDLFQFLNIINMMFFFMIYLKSIEYYQSNRKIVLGLFFLLVPLTLVYFLNSVEDSIFLVGSMLFLSGYHLKKNNWTILGAVICVLFKEYLALALIIYSGLQLINEWLFKLPFQLILGFYICLLVLFFSSIYSTTDVIRYSFPFLSYYLIVCFSENQTSSAIKK